MEVGEIDLTKEVEKSKRLPQSSTIDLLKVFTKKQGEKEIIHKIPRARIGVSNIVLNL